MTAFAHIRRIVAILFWVVAAFVWWFVLLQAALRLAVHYHWQPVIAMVPGSAEWIIFCVLWSFAAISLIVAALLLGIRGQLPGTRMPTRILPGFPIKPAASR